MTAPATCPEVRGDLRHLFAAGETTCLCGRAHVVGEPAAKASQTDAAPFGPVMITLPAEEIEQLRAHAARYLFLRGRFLRTGPINVNAWGAPTYGLMIKAAHDLTPDEFDRLIDALDAADDGVSLVTRLQPASVEPTGLGEFNDAPAPARPVVEQRP